GKKIGKIKEVKIIPKSATEKESLQVVVQKRFLLKRALTVTFNEKSIIKTELDKLWLDITTAEYNEFITKLVAQRKQMVKSAKFAEASSTNKASALGFTWGKV
ncbi:MAG: hypothetical protein ACTSR1_04270, partial [Candidatus Heimdallarchaeota archaeon]